LQAFKNALGALLIEGFAACRQSNAVNLIVKKPES